MKEQIIERAKELQEDIRVIRRSIHRHPGTGFDVDYALDVVSHELRRLGCEPIKCGKAGIVTLIGGQKPGKVILLRADMDALPITEEADVEYKSEAPGKMHGCGHDMHTAMLLGAVQLLKENEHLLHGTVKIMFQPAEEIFQGAKDMIEAGVLKEPDVDAAMMLHVTTGLPIPAGMILVPAAGVSMASCEQYHIRVIGKGGHGSMPHTAVDPITVAAQIHLAMQEVPARELEPGTFAVFTTGKMTAGEASNIIPNHADMWGTIRTLDKTGQVGEQIKKRMQEIAEGIATAMRCEAQVEFFDYCPCFVADEKMASFALANMKQLWENNVTVIPKPGSGSEDFAFVSQEVPAIGLHLSAGDATKGYTHNLHHPKATFDDEVLWRGSATYAYMALKYLEG